VLVEGWIAVPVAVYSLGILSGRAWFQLETAGVFTKHSSSVSRLATPLLKALISAPNHGFFNRMRWGALPRCSERVASVWRSGWWKYKLHGWALRVPLSDELPIFLRSDPLYSGNQGRIAACLSAKYSDLMVIDIGANIGGRSLFPLPSLSRTARPLQRRQPRFHGRLNELRVACHS
jgi:hypothetical protein